MLIPLLVTNDGEHILWVDPRTVRAVGQMADGKKYIGFHGVESLTFFKDTVSLTGIVKTINTALEENNHDPMAS